MFHIYKLQWKELAAKAEERMDRRARRTRQAIREAFVSLLGEKGYNEISVTDIAEAAGINRKTFYNYYEDIHAVADEVSSVAISALSDSLTEEDFVSAVTDPGRIFSKIIDAHGMDDGPYAKLFRNDYYGSLASAIAEMVKERWKTALLRQAGAQEPNTSVFVDYAVAGMVSLYRSWANGGFGVPFESVAALAGRMTLQAFNATLQKD